MFGRSRRKGSDDAEDDDLELDDLDAEDDDLGDDPDTDADTVLPAPPVRPTGPWDEADLPPDDERERIDLGGLRVPVTGGHELRVDVDQASGGVTAVTLATPTSMLQVMAYAAPKSAGIWDEVREEIAGAIAAGGGSSSDAQGPYGVELRAQVPTDQPGQLAPARFVGVDGPRWFLRAMVQGKAAVEPDADGLLFDALKQVVVVRGQDAMAVRDPLPLRLPADLATPVAAPEPEAPTLSLPERGPEITETR